MGLMTMLEMDNSQAPFFRSNRQPTPVPGGVAGAAGGRG